MILKNEYWLIKKKLLIIKNKFRNNFDEQWFDCVSTIGVCMYIFKAPVEFLQFSLAEVGLSFQLIQTLWTMTHHCYLQIIIHHIYR